MSATTTRGDVNLNYLFKFSCINVGRMKYMLNNPEFRKRMTDLTLRKVHVNEQILKDVLTELYDDAINGKFDASDLSLSAVRNMIRRLEREIESQGVAAEA